MAEPQLVRRTGLGIDPNGIAGKGRAHGDGSGLCWSHEDIQVIFQKLDATSGIERTFSFKRLEEEMAQ